MKSSASVSRLVTLLAATSHVLCAAGMAQSLDGLEDIGPDGTPVTSRVIDGVTVAISNSGATGMTARTYGSDTDVAFGGAGGPNIPLHPEQVTGTRFISASTTDDYFDEDQPLIFSLSAPVSALGLTTLDLLEGAVGNGQFIVLRAFDAQGTVVAEHRRQGAMDVSGVVLVWRVSSASTNISEVHLLGNLSSGTGYGLDDIFVRVEPLVSLELEISQESSAGMDDFDSNVLGLIETVDYNLTPAQFYSWLPLGGSYTGPRPSTDERSLFYVFRSATTSEQSLGVVHDSVHDGTGGAASTEVTILGDANGAAFMVRDCPGDSYSGAPGDATFTADQVWLPCCTDGYVIGALEGTWTAFMEFTSQPTGISSWLACSGDGSGIPLVLEPGRRVRIRSLATDGVVGTRYCFGDGTGVACPCGNPTAPGQGCATSTRSGAVLTGVGSPSISADDLVVTATGVPAGKFGVIFMSAAQVEAQFGDGLQCAGGSVAEIFRFPVRNSGLAGVIEEGPGLSGFSVNNFSMPGWILSGTTFNFQAWFRDDAHDDCDGGFNLSNALNVTFGL